MCGAGLHETIVNGARELINLLCKLEGKGQPGEDVVEVTAASVQTMDHVAVIFPLQRTSISVRAVWGYYLLSIIIIIMFVKG